MAAALLVLILPAFSGCLGGSGDAPGPSATDGAGDAPTLPEGLEMEGADVVSYNETRVTWRWQDAIGPGYCCADESTSNAAVTTFDVPRDIPLMVVATLSWDPDGTPARYVAVRDEGGHQVCGRAQYLTLAGAESPPLTCGGEVPRLDAQSTWSVYVDQTANHHPAKPFTVHLTLAVDLADDTTFMFEEPARVADQVHPNEQESFIMVSPDGQTILTCQHGEFQEPSPMFASTDGGETFRRLEAPPDAAVGGDCDVALDEDGTWYFLSSTVAGATVLATDDEGATWDVVNPLAAVPVNGMADRPWLQAVGPSTLYLSYTAMGYVQPGQPGGVAFTRSDDGGATWSTPVTIAPPEGAERTSTFQGRMMVSNGGETVQIPIVRLPPNPCGCAGARSSLELATSTDGGSTWELSPILGPLDGLTTVATAARAGADVYWPFGIDDGEMRGFYVLHSSDGGSTWDAPVRILADPGDGGSAENAWTSAWVDGRPDGTATLVADVDGSVLGPARAGIPYLVAVRLDAGLEGFVVDLANVAPHVDQEYVAVDHDAAGRAYVTFTADKDNGHHVAVEAVTP